MSETQFDLLIIGGGINGVGIARNAAGRGLRVCLVEKDDLSAHTSSQSSKLIHGGLRYLEYYEFGLVRTALHERDILLHIAPQLVQPLQFVIPDAPHIRSPFLLRMGLFLYNHLNRSHRLPAAHRITLQSDLTGAPLKSSFKKGFIYPDCFVDDARLVITNALSAAELGATILPRTTFLAAKRQQDAWHALIFDNHSKAIHCITARAVINATGPWVSEIAEKSLHTKTQHHIKWVQGSHIVVPKLYTGDHAYLLQHTDGRIIFVIPYEDRYHLVGTTEKDYTADLNNPSISQDEIDYLCGIVNNYFEKEIQPQHVIWHYSGVRPLIDDGTTYSPAISRDYSLELQVDNHLPLINVFGGKITTYRLLSEQVLKKLQPFFPTLNPSWTHQTRLPGSDFEQKELAAFIQEFCQHYSWLPTELAQRYAKTYGTRASLFLHNKHQLTDLGEAFAHGLYQAEIDYLMQYEWAQTAEDILWRRTKLGLLFTPEETAALADKLSYLHKGR